MRPGRRTWGEPAQFTVKSPADAAAPAGVQEKRREDPDWEMIWPKVEGEFSLRESTTPMTAVRVAGMKAPGAHTLPGIGSKVGEGGGRCRECTRSSDRGRGSCCKSRAKKRRGRNSDENNSLRLGVDHSGASFDGRAEARREAAAAAGWREQNKGAVLPAAHGGEHIGRDDWPLRAGGAAGKDDARVGGDGGGVGDDAHGHVTAAGCKGASGEQKRKLEDGTCADSTVLHVELRHAGKALGGGSEQLIRFGRCTRRG